MSIPRVRMRLIVAAFHTVILPTALLAQSKGNSQQSYNENDFEPYGIYSAPDGYVEIIVVGPHIVGFFTDVDGDASGDCGSCPNGGQRLKYFEGTTTPSQYQTQPPAFSGWHRAYSPGPVKFTGTMWLCTKSKELLTDCPNLKDVWTTPVKGTFDRTSMRITLEYEGQYYERKDDGEFNCTPTIKTHNIALWATMGTRWEHFKKELAEDNQELKNKVNRLKNDIRNTKESEIDRLRRMEEMRQDPFGAARKIAEDSVNHGH